MASASLRSRFQWQVFVEAPRSLAASSAPSHLTAGLARVNRQWQSEKGVNRLLVRDKKIPNDN